MTESSTIQARPGEEVDADALLKWLHTQDSMVVADDAACEIRQFPAGFSNLTYLVVIGSHSSGDARTLVLRRPPRGVKAGAAHDMAREHAILSALHPLGVPVPQPVARCDDVSVIGAPFYLMDFVDGEILRHKLPSSVGGDEESRALLMRDLCGELVATLAQLHSVDVSRGPLASLGRPDGYATRQVQGWTRRWSASWTDEIQDLDVVAQWLADNIPEGQGATLVHNDFKFDNLVLDLGIPRVKAILDWEMATVGDPLMDLGTALAYWVEAGDPPIFRSLGLGITTQPGCLSRAGLVAEYARLTGRDVRNIDFYYAFGLFKVAIIAQQIYARHVKGLTADPRFGQLLPVIRALGEKARQVVSQ